jgi:putative ABC transport system permease protein
MLSAMFLFTYVRRELCNRKLQAAFVAAGLAVGIGLVITVTAASSGVKNAQAAVLHELYGIGTDISVTKPPPPPPKSLRANNAGGFSFGNQAQHVDVLGNGGLGLLDASYVRRITGLAGVAAAAGGLTLQDIKLTVPTRRQIGAGGRPPASAFPTITNVDGVDVAKSQLGPLSAGALTEGRDLRSSDADKDVTVVDANYARANKLRLGSSLTLAKTRFTVVGIVQQPQGGGAADAYIPLERAQALGSRRGGHLTGFVNTIYIKATSATNVGSVRSRIEKLLPAATVTSSSSLANAVSGSIANAATLANNLGRWLAVVVLLAAFALASLLTVGAVSRRVREIGTLKALGWRSRRIVAQVITESVVIGLTGAVLGVGIGFGGAALVKRLAPALSATVAASPGAAPQENVSINATGLHHNPAPGSTHTVIVHLAAPVTVTALALAILLALAGGLLAGSFGGWRAARLRPAEALARIE